MQHLYVLDVRTRLKLCNECRKLYAQRALYYNTDFFVIQDVKHVVLLKPVAHILHAPITRGRPWEPTGTRCYICFTSAF